MTELLGGKYEVLELAGEGGMAKVYRGQTHGAAGFTRPVAIKRVLAPLSQNPEFLKMFVEEARVVSELDHPNIAHYLVLEWVDGLTLSDWRQGYREHGNHTPWTLTAAIGIEVLEALHAAHVREDSEGRPAPVFHRDVTPQNVMLSNCGIVKLTDFGLARAMDRSSITKPGFVKGKLSYLAPELTYEAEPSAQTDVFSVGVVLWEVLAGEKLFKDKDPLKVLGTMPTRDHPQGAATQPYRTLCVEQRHGAGPRDPPTHHRRSHGFPPDLPKRSLGPKPTRPGPPKRTCHKALRRQRGPNQSRLRRRNHPRHQHPPHATQVALGCQCP
jgi:serine/threonine-protein kinase